MSFYAQMLMAHRDNPRVARMYAASLIAGSPSPYATMALADLVAGVEYV